jgi:hypothetical protein
MRNRNAAVLMMPRIAATLMKKGGIRSVLSLTETASISV